MAPILVSMDRGGPYLYTGSKYRTYQAFLIEKPGMGLQQTSPSEDVLQKLPRVDLGLHYIC